MDRFANRAILVLCVLALLFSIDCSVGDETFSHFAGLFDGCFQRADLEGKPIILTLNSPETGTGGASNDLRGSFTFFSEDLRRCYIGYGNLVSRKKAKLTLTGEVPITVTRTEADGIVTMTMEFSDGSSVGPLERSGDPPEELCPTECP